MSIWISFDKVSRFHVLFVCAKNEAVINKQKSGFMQDNSKCRIIEEVRSDNIVSLVSFVSLIRGLSNVRISLRN